MDRDTLKGLVYDLANGHLDLERQPVDESRYVKNEFGPESYCGEKYDLVYEANRRLCRRLGLEDGEDADVECIISSLLDIQRFLGEKMFEYGWMFREMEAAEKERKASF